MSTTPRSRTTAGREARTPDLNKEVKEHPWTTRWQDVRKCIFPYVRDLITAAFVVTAAMAAVFLLQGITAGQLLGVGLILGLFSAGMLLAFCVTGRATLTGTAITVVVAVLWWQLVARIPGLWAVAGGAGSWDTAIAPEYGGRIVLAQITGVTVWLLHRSFRSTGTAYALGAVTAADQTALVRRIQQTQQAVNAPHLFTSARIAGHEAAHVLGWVSTGGEIVCVDMRPSGEYGAHVEAKTPGNTPQDAEWSALVGAVAGNVADQDAGVWDIGSRDDIRNAAVNVAAILSIGVPPTGVDVALTSDALITTARDIARRILRDNADVHEQLTEYLVQAGKRRIPRDELTCYTTQIS